MSSPEPVLLPLDLHLPCTFPALTIQKGSWSSSQVTVPSDGSPQSQLFWPKANKEPLKRIIREAQSMHDLVSSTLDNITFFPFITGYLVLFTSLRLLNSEL